MKQLFKLRSIAVVFLVIWFGSCDRNRNHPGWDYFPDMFYSEAYETYTPNPNFADGKTLREPVEGTVSREITPFMYGTGDQERARAGRELVNPYADDPDAVKRGKEVFGIYCANCHGEKGDGKGYLHTSGKYPAVPRSLVNEVAISLKDGEIYHSITLGFGSMGSHASQIRPEDRWKVISYIRTELQSGENSSLNISE